MYEIKRIPYNDPTIYMYAVLVYGKEVFRGSKNKCEKQLSEIKEARALAFGDMMHEALGQDIN